MSAAADAVVEGITTVADAPCEYRRSQPRVGCVTSHYPDGKKHNALVEGPLIRQFLYVRSWQVKKRFKRIETSIPHCPYSRRSS